MNYTIIEANDQDINKIQELALEIWPTAFEQILSKDQIDFMLEMMYSQKSLKKQIDFGHKFILLYKSSLKGYISYQLEYAPKILKIEKLYLHPEMKGKGYGKLLISHVEKIARENRKESMRLNVNRWNNHAIDFYRHLDFIIIKEEDISIGNGYLMQDYVMEKFL